jgi:hypothetical protein
MGHHDLRHDKECQNCGYTVDKAYCSQCGQHNTETRQPFHHLITHTIEDITHYDGNFWKTIKYLMFRPGKLTLEYLMGHRMRYVPPVKLYIFISFVTFFLIGVLPDYDVDKKQHEEEIIEDQKDYEDFIKNGMKVKNDSFAYHSIHELDSVQDSRPKNQKMGLARYWITKANLNASEKRLGSEYMKETFFHTLPKVLFIYMPIFTFLLWLVHGKKRWMFFDHGIFTLHYFSLLLLLVTISNMTNCLIGYISISLADSVAIWLAIISFGYAFFYFFRSHRRMYGEKRYISRLKSMLLFIVNMILISIVLVISVIYIMLNAH